MIDDWIKKFDKRLRILVGVVSVGARPLPERPSQNDSPRALPNTLVAPSQQEGSLAVVQEDQSLPWSIEEKRHAARLMRVNHVGEICAQALYEAQKQATRSMSLRVLFERAALEEEDHLNWTAQRLQQLGTRPSLLNPFWYGGAFALGLLAGLFGDRFSLGLMGETERQVEQHLAGHLQQWPSYDHVSLALLERMLADEVAHGKNAMDAGGIALPELIRFLMRVAARVMTSTAYYL